jgi:hypothetical protein
MRRNCSQVYASYNPILSTSSRNAVAGHQPDNPTVH